MSRYLPYSGFKLVKNCDNFDLNSISETSKYGYILEVDLEYPKELHEMHNYYPLAHNMLSQCLKIVHKYVLKVGGVKKLVPNLGKKSNYIVLYMNLKLYLSLGMKLIKIHKISKFKQAPWKKKYIDFNTQNRKKAGSEFEKTLLKLMNNSIYGKTVENLRKRLNVKLVNNSKDSNIQISNR